MEFHIKYIFVALSGVFLMCTAWADCDPGYYLACGEDPYDNSCTECDCVPCDPGYTSDGTGVLYYCPNTYPTSPYGDDRCRDAGYCADYGDCPAGAPAGRKCKQVEDCDGITGCTRYELCNIATGAVAGYFVPESNVCHMESGVCKPNTASCSQFPIQTMLTYFNVVSTDQSGNATWHNDGDNSAWDTINCKLNALDKNLSSITVMGHTQTVKCDDFNVIGEVESMYQFLTKKLSDPVQYTLRRTYCEKCHEGYLPNIQSSPNAGADLFPEGYTGSYGVMMCDTLVSAPNYAPGCTIPYPLNSTTMPNTCRVACPQNMETLENGATSIDDCVPMGVTYEDSTGSFRLGSDSNLCN